VAATKIGTKERDSGSQENSLMEKLKLSNMPKTRKENKGKGGTGQVEFVESRQIVNEGKE